MSEPDHRQTCSQSNDSTIRGLLGTALHENLAKHISRYIVEYWWVLHWAYSSLKMHTVHRSSHTAYKYIRRRAADEVQVVHMGCEI